MPHWSDCTDWIWVPDYEEHQHVARIVQFRKTFTLDTPPPQCLIHISADTRYRLFVNGQSVSFGPAKSHLGEWNYETVDIAPFCRAGTNVVAARVLRYSPRFSGNMSMARAAIPGFILYSADLEISTNTTWRCKIDEAVTILPSERWNPALGPSLLVVNEEVEGGKEDRHWVSPEYDDAGWEVAVKSSMKAHMVPVLEPRRLVPRSIPLLPETERQFGAVVKHSDIDVEWDALLQGNPATIPSQSQVTVVLDAGSLTTGFLQLQMKGGAATHIRIRCAECFETPSDTPNPNPFARCKGNRTDASGVLVGMDDYYTIDHNIATDTSTSYEPFWFRTFRYVELTITTLSMPVELHQINYRETHYPLPITTSLSSFPSEEVQKQWSISLHTLRNCMHETYEDCPFYEQNQFAMDARLQILFTYQLSPDDRLARKCMQEFYASRRADGLLETHFPAPSPVVNIPYFSLYWVLIVHDHMMYRGDETLVRRYLGTVDGILDHFDARIAANGLVGRFEHDVWPFVDWTREWAQITPGGDFRSLAVPPAYHRTGQTSYGSLLYAYTLQKAAQLCEFVGRNDTAQEYRGRAESVNKAVIAHCSSSAPGTAGPGGMLLLDGPDSPDDERSQHAHVFAVLSGALQGETARNALSQALTDPSFVRCSYAMSFYVFEAARETGLYTELRQSLLQPWSDMIAQNLTTWAESAAMPRSDCHGWSAVPIHDFVANVVGLRPGAPGFGRIRFEPRRDLWPVMKGSFAVGTGRVQVQWEPGRPVTLMSEHDVTVEVYNESVSSVQELVAGAQTEIHTGRS